MIGNEAPRPVAARWQDDAACYGMDPDLFHPGVGQTAGRARAVCSTCPVTADCLRFAVDNELTAGIYGGLTADERAHLRPRRNEPQPIRHGTEGGHRTHLRRGETPCAACLKALRVAQAERRAQAS